MKNLTGIILAGGKSNRMGKDKGFIKYAGKYLIEYPLEICRSICDEILISTGNREYERFGYPLIKDEYAGIGPIGGIYSALKRASNHQTILLPCDTPLLKKEMFELLLRNTNDADLVVPYTGESVMEPLCACYSKSLLPLMKNQIEIKDYKLHNLIEKARSKKIKIDDSYGFYFPGLFVNMNHSDDLN
jgi:molybdenum cofactor guanylyltransferase